MQSVHGRASHTMRKKVNQTLRKSVVYMTSRLIWGQLFPRRIHHQPPSPVRRTKNRWMTDPGSLLSSTSFSSTDFLYAFLRYSSRNLCNDLHKVTEAWSILLRCRYVRKDALFGVICLGLSFRLFSNAIHCPANAVLTAEFNPLVWLPPYILCLSHLLLLVDT